MKRLFKLIRQTIENLLQFIKRNNLYFDSLAKGLIIITSILFITYTSLIAIEANAFWIFLRFGFIYLGFFCIALIINWILGKTIYFSKLFIFSILISVPLLIIITDKSILISLFLFCLLLLANTLVYIFRKEKFKDYSFIKKGITVLGCFIFLICSIALVIFYNISGFETHPPRNAASLTSANIEHISMQSPSVMGGYKVKKLTYGTGKDKHRIAYGKDVSIKTPSVNCRNFIQNWSGFTGWWRSRYWGFNQNELPLNARVWYPNGAGPFPLVLIVHGEHPMQDYSDSGYAYLGELLASKGYIVASVDQNFINLLWSYTSGALFEENDARAILLLEHLKLWHKWNNDIESVFYNKIDINNIALIGHSKGGEAIAHATLFNKLPYYPDNASIKFDYNYNIKSLVAIAAVDGQYKPSRTKTILENINYLTLHGSYDGDVQSFGGLKQYERITFNDSNYHFKSALFIHGANHGQFNTTWGNKDSSNPFSGLLNLKPLISSENQREIAKVYISAFLETTLKTETSYLSLFIDHRTGKNWLPDTVYLNSFEDSKTEYLCTFDEDFDLSTTTLDKGRISTKKLTIWKELNTRSRSKAVVLGWDNGVESNKGSFPNFKIEVPPNIINVDSSSVFVFSMVDSKSISKPASYGRKGLIEFSIILIDDSGEQVNFLSSDFSFLQERLDVAIKKTDFLTNSIKRKKMFQSFSFPLLNIKKLNNRFNLSKLNSIYFVFDKTEKGVVMIDKIGFMKNLSELGTNTNLGIRRKIIR